jgi:hypothetical protein
MASVYTHTASFLNREAFILECHCIGHHFTLLWPAQDLNISKNLLYSKHLEMLKFSGSLVERDDGLIVGG